MNSTDIQKTLSNPTEVFHSTDSDGKTIVVLAYPAEHEAELLTVAKELKTVLQSGNNYIEINKTKDGKRCDLMVSSPKLSNPLFFGDLQCTESTYDELLLQKNHDEQVSLAFYIYQKQVLKTQEEIDEAKAQDDYDEFAVIQIDEPTYTSVTIPVEGAFAVKSDDSLGETASFYDEDPNVALAVAAQIRKQEEESKED